MTARVINDTTLGAWVDALIREQTVYGVRARGDRFAFGPLARAADLRLDHDVTILPPKKYFLPSKEVLMEFDRSEMRFKTVLDGDRFVVFGVHPCDMAAISQLDAIFSGGNHDLHYMTRRENATIVVCDVQNPSQHVFAGCMGTSSAEDVRGHDVALTRLEDGSNVVEALTAKGEALMASMSGGSIAEKQHLDDRTRTWERNRRRLRKHDLKMAPEDLPGLLERSYDHPVWEEKSELCHSCGSCNLVCPTCYCFDVEDDLDWNMETGRRARTWSACMLAGFAVVAGGHNFRGTRAARYRHRYFRKGKYSRDTGGEIACIGCGRCIAACTTGIANPVDVFNRLLEDGR